MYKYTVYTFLYIIEYICKIQFRRLVVLFWQLHIANLAMRVFYLPL